MNRIISIAMALGLMLMMPVPTLAAVFIGKVLLSKGVVTSLSAGGELMTLAKGSEVFKLDTISTAQDSFVVVKMIDDTKLSLRPNSEITLDDYNNTEGEEVATIGLIKGGLRTLTGAIGKKKPEEFNINTTVATIGIRGTDFAARICEVICVDSQCQNPCAVEEEKLKAFERVTAAPEAKKAPVAADAESSSESTLVGCKPLSDINEGMYVGLFDGKIIMTSGDQIIEVEAVAAALAQNGELGCLDEMPNFLSLDKYFSDDQENTVTLFNILKNIDDEKQRCIVPES